MSSSKCRPWKLTINWLARRVPPMREPFFPCIFGAVFVVVAVWVIPRLPTTMMEHPFWKPILVETGAVRVLRGVIYTVSATAYFTALCLWSRCVELCWPDYFDPFHDRHQ